MRLERKLTAESYPQLTPETSTIALKSAWVIIPKTMKSEILPLLLLLLNVIYVNSNENTCSKESHEEGCDSSAIDYSLNGLDQEDPILIQAIKERFLVPPNPKKKLKLQQKLTADILYGQYGQPAEVDKIFK